MKKRTDTVREAAFGDRTDRILATFQIGVLASFLTDYAFTLYLISPADWIWAIIAAPAAILLMRLGYGVQTFIASRLKWEKIEFDPEKSAREYFRLSRSLIAFLISISVGAAFFAAAFGIRQLNYSLVEHETIARATGYIYETVAAACGIVVFFIGAVLWFFPDEILFGGDANPILSAAAPAVAAVVFVILLGVPVYAALLYLAVYYVFFLTRRKRVSRHEKTLKKQQQLEAEAKHRSRWE
jgi:MFS family permease